MRSTTRNNCKKKIFILLLTGLIINGVFAQGNTSQLPSKECLTLGGKLNDLMAINSSRWLEVADILNPSVFGFFENRENPVPQVPWFGEFPGKLLTSIAYSYKMTKSPELLKAGNRIVDKFAATQAHDGYLGSFKYDDRFSGILGSGTWKNWDLWNHYHNIWGLYSWYLQTGNETCMEIAVKAANYLIEVFKTRKYSDTAETQMNLAISHAYMLLYNEPSILNFITKTQRDTYYMDAKRIVDEEWVLPTAGNWYNEALKGTEFYQTTMHRWEVLHCVLTLAEIYKADKKKNGNYFKAFEQIYWSILKTDVHNNGSFSTGEGACGNPYIAGNKEPLYSGSIETCCTIAWAELSAAYLELTNDSYIADELERTTLTGAISTMLVEANQPVYTYDTPMNGAREAAIHTLHWQGVKGAPDVSCCQMNGPKSLGLISLWGIANSDDKIFLNYYGESTAKIKTPSGNMLTLTQETDYPISGNIKIKIGLDSSEKLRLNLRIPFWSKQTSLKLNGRDLKNIKARTYYELKQTFKNGDVIELVLNMSPHYWGGEDKFTGFASVYWGPMILAHDEQVSGVIPDLNREFDLQSIQDMRIKKSEKPHVWMEAEVLTVDNEKITLCDFISAGQTPAKTYNSWFKVKGVPTISFTKEGIPVWGSTIFSN